MCNDNYRGRSYCRTGECSRTIEHCLTKSALVASSHSARARALFPFLDINHLLVWALWSCGRRDRVVQAQRQIHRALGKAGIIKPSWYPSCRSTNRPAPLRVAVHRFGRGGRVTLAARQRSSLRRRCEFWTCVRVIVNRYVTILRRRFPHRLGWDHSAAA